MKTIKLKTSDIELEQKEATCSFCSEENKNCVETPEFFVGSVHKIKNAYSPNITYGLSYEDFEWEEIVESKERGFFGDQVKTKQAQVLKDDASKKYGYWFKELDYETVEVKKKASICHDCVRQLADQIKK